jgi:pimeloyl-[acyl-carrier protein] methyl ester esterase
MKLQPFVQVSGSGPNLVLLHGWGLHGGIWQTILPLLEMNFTVHNVDLPGFGHSPIHNGEYDLDYLVESVQSVLPEKCYLMGWSLGGVIATALALKDSETLNENTASCKIDKLITVASNPCFVARHDWPFGMKQTVLESFIHYLAEDFKGTLIKFLAIQTMGSPTQKEDVAQLKETVFMHGLPAEKALKGGLQILRDVNLLPKLKNLKIPFLRIYGKLDTLVPVKSVEPVSNVVTNSESIIFTKSGHSPFLSESELFVKTLVNFLSMKEVQT